MSSLPRLVRISGVAAEPVDTPRTAAVGITFSLYRGLTGGAPLWQEVQNVTLDAGGHYSVLLGADSKDGVPDELFTSNEAGWLGVQVEQDPVQPRVSCDPSPRLTYSRSAFSILGMSSSPL